MNLNLNNMYIAFVTLEIIGIILFLASIMMNSLEDKTRLMISSISGLIFIMAMLFYIMRDREPSAIDVYRGKTTIQVTYQDGSAIDSVVVFKR